jgi:hypothetical protein
MIRFIFTLDHRATALQEAVIRSGLEGRFPEIRFEYGEEVIEDFENSIILVAGEPHPTEPHLMLAKPIPQDLVVEVREAFGELLREARSIRSF